MGAELNDNANVATSNSTPTTSESILESISFATLLKGATYRNQFIDEPSRKSVNFHTLIAPRMAYSVIANYVKNTWSKYGLVKSKLNSSNGLFFFNFGSKDIMNAMLENEDVGNVLVWVKFHGVHMTVFSEYGLSAITTKLSTPLMLDSYTSDMCFKSWFKLSYARAMIEPRTDEELKDTIVGVMPKLVGEGFYMCTIRFEYEWKPPPKCSSCKVFGHFLDKCPKNIISDVVKNLKNPRQAAKGVQVGTKVDFKPIKQVYRAISNRNDANSSGKKEASCVRWEGANSGVFSSDHEFFNVASSSTTPIVERIDKIERQIINGKLTLVDDDGKPLPKVVSIANVDSDSEVKDVVDDHVVFKASTSLKRGANSGYGTNSLFEQWRTTKRDDDYDPYDDDLYESHDMSKNLQAICDDIDITVYGRKKK
ncbi:hypothetical protein Tco_0616171 [Tanacetum coccineum]